MTIVEVSQKWWNSCRGGWRCRASRSGSIQRKEMFAVLAVRAERIALYGFVEFKAFSGADCHDCLETAWDSLIEAKF